jgi:DNA-directed RNA polymerase subunit M/transcription elongation factor TFIIS
MSGLVFCKQCENMLYDLTERDGEAFRRCRKPECDYEEVVTKESPIVYDHELHRDTSVQYSINPYLKHDSTLPRFNTMVCPNRSCATRAPGQTSDIVGIKLDSVNVAWMYQCAVCDSIWKQNGKAAKTS